MKTFDDFMDTFDADALRKEVREIMIKSLEEEQTGNLFIDLSSGLTQTSTHVTLRLLRAYHEWLSLQQ